ncbi:MAG: hypothetical protein RLZZ58_1349 [Pseudomonadota bacterium]
MTIQPLFATPFYTGHIDAPDLIADLGASCRLFAEEDKAGRAWSKDRGYRGYTSYASLNDLPQRDPAFADLKKRLDRHVRAFAAVCHFDLAKPLRLDSMWVNILKPGGAHSGHIHPHSVVSGTIYVDVPPGSGALRLEDPRLPMLMAAPLRTDDAPAADRPFFFAEPADGTVFLWESWLRHEVMPNAAKQDRISISFNYS